MLRIFTTPTIMQRYVADPITYRFTTLLKERYSNPIIFEESDSLYLVKDQGVVNILKKVMRSQSGFSYHYSNDTMKWVHHMKPDLNYFGSKLVITLKIEGDYLKFSTEIILGRKKRSTYAASIFGYIAVLGFFLILGFAGSYESNMITTSQFILRSAITFVVTACSIYIEQKVNPCFYSEEDEDNKERSKSRKYHTNRRVK